MKTSRFFIYCLIAAFTLAGCKSYDVDYRGPDGQKKYSLNKDKISKKEKAAWQKATTANSVNSYKEYIKDFPDGKYIAEARSIIDSAYNRNDELLVMYPDNPYDQDLAALFNQPVKTDVELKIVVKDAKTLKYFEDATVRLRSANANCKVGKNNATTNNLGAANFQIKKGCCYTIYVSAISTSRISKKICTDDLENNVLAFSLEKKGTTIISGSSNVVYNEADKKYYHSGTGKLFTGRFKGKKIVNGIDVNDKKAVAAANEERLWNDILDTDDNDVAKSKIQSYLQKFPNGKHAEDVANMLKSFEQTSGTGGDGGATGEDEETETGNTSKPKPIVTSPPTVAANDTILTTKTLSEDCALNVKSKGILAYNTLPTSMKMDTSYALEILINDLLNLGKIKTVVEEKTGEELDTTQLVHEGTTTIGNNVVEMIRIGSWMRVTLGEPKNQNAFSISNVYETNEENLRGKNIDCDMNVKWKFLIEPKKGGDHKLLLNFYIKNNEDAPYRILLDEEKTISVKVKKPWYAQMWVQGIFVIGLLSLFLLWWRNRKKKQPDHVFGANLGIAGGLQEVATPPAKPKSIFIAYAKEDEEWTKQIYNQMKVLHKGGYANIWYDQLMEAGAEYKAEIFKHLEESDIIMLNISSDFLACDFCDELLQKAMERHERGEGVMLIPIIVRPCLWATTPLAKMMVFPQNKKPLSDEEWKNADNAIVNVMNEMEGKILN